MKFKEIVARFNGFSTPIFGVSWTPPAVDRDVARKVLIYLEDKRVLYQNPDREISNHVIASALNMREFFTEVLGQGGIAEELVAPLRAMRKACREFLDATDTGEAEQRQLMVPGPLQDRMRVISLAGGIALRELRQICGVQIGLIAVRYGLDVEEQLAALLPANPAEAGAK